MDGAETTVVSDLSIRKRAEVNSSACFFFPFLCSVLFSFFLFLSDIPDLFHKRRFRQEQVSAFFPPKQSLHHMLCFII